MPGKLKTYIFSIAYKRKITVRGESKEKAVEALNKQINKDLGLYPLFGYKNNRELLTQSGDKYTFLVTYSGYESAKAVNGEKAEKKVENIFDSMEFLSFLKNDKLNISKDIQLKLVIDSSDKDGNNKNDKLVKEKAV